MQFPEGTEEIEIDTGVHYIDGDLWDCRVIIANDEHGQPKIIRSERRKITVSGGTTVDDWEEH